MTLNEIMDRWKRQTQGRLWPILTRQPRRIPRGEHILNRMTHGLTVMVCSACEDDRTLKNRGYVELRRFHGDAKCDGCQEFGPIAMWLFEDSVWHRDLQHEDTVVKKIRQRDAAMRERDRYGRQLIV